MAGSFFCWTVSQTATRHNQDHKQAQVDVFITGIHMVLSSSKTLPTHCEKQLQNVHRHRLFCMAGLYPTRAHLTVDDTHIAAAHFRKKVVGKLHLCDESKHMK